MGPVDAPSFAAVMNDIYNWASDYSSYKWKHKLFAAGVITTPCVLQTIHDASLRTQPGQA